MTFAGTSANGQDAPFPAVRCGSRQGASWTHKRHSAEPLFDHLVSSLQDRLRHGQAERLSGLEIDNQLEPGRLLNRQIGRLLTLEDLSDVSAGLAKGRSEARSI